MTVKKEVKKSTAKATAAAQADESMALETVAKSGVPTKSRSVSPLPVTKPAKAALKPTTAKKSVAKPAVGAPEPKHANPIATGKKNPTKEIKGSKAAAKTSSKASNNSERDEKQEAKTARVLDSQVAYEGPLFRVLRDRLIEPDGRESQRDVIRHNGSVVILAVNHHGKEAKHKRKHKKDPWIVIERQYRHAAGQYLWELPAGKLDAGEEPIDGAKRELGEETGYQAEKWSPLVEYYASPGFLGEAMKVFLAEGLIAGDAHPEEDEHIDFRLVRLSEVLEMVDQGKIIDGKTLTSVLLYARKLGIKRKK